MWTLNNDDTEIEIEEGVLEVEVNAKYCIVFLKLELVFPNKNRTEINISIIQKLPCFRSKCEDLCIEARGLGQGWTSLMGGAAGRHSKRAILLT